MAPVPANRLIEPQHQIQGPQPLVQPRLVSERADCSSILLSLIESVAQLAIRAIFVAANILMASAAMPYAWHSFVIPICAIGSAAMAAFFFPSFKLLESSGESVSALRPVQVPENGMYPENYPIGSPVGYNRIGLNCAFNSAAHFLDSDPKTAAWVRQPPITDEVVLNDFLRYLQRNGSPPALVAAFTEYVANQPQDRPSIPVLFDQFLSQYQPPAAIQDEVRKIRGVYRLFQIFLPNFFKANDEAIRRRIAVSAGRSETLRAGLSAISPATISASNFEQTDATEVILKILDFAPDDLKMHVEKTYHFNIDGGLPAMAEARQPRRERETILPLPLDRNTPNGTSLESLLQTALRNTQVEPQRYMGVDHRPHDYPVNEEITEFIEPPKVIRFGLNRFTFERPTPSLLSRWFPSIFPPFNWRGVKLETQIECPNEIEIPVRGRGNIRYRLAGFVTHIGGYSGGHYISGQIRNGHKYLHNDSHVTYVEGPEHQEYWDRQLNSAYLLSYVPVEEPLVQNPLE